MSMNAQQLQEAKESLKKLPILGPALWLFARDERKKFTFIADQDWLVMPPLILDQCKLYMKDEIPWAFCTWAFVSDQVDERLSSSIPKIAPHEWKSGEHLWLIDVVAPFGGADEIITDLQKTNFAGKAFKALTPRPNGSFVVENHPAVAPQAESGQ
jgi:cytolysin-activating lysine-acyltransferase